MKKLRFLLLDANIIIKLHELGIWRQVLDRCDVIVAHTIVEHEAKYYSDATTDKLIDLATDIASKRIGVVEVDTATLKTFLDRFDPLYKGEFGYGDVWTWTALDADTKLMIGYHLGLRTPGDAAEFMMDLAGRINNITQITTDGLKAYPEAIRNAFGNSVNYAQIIKVYRAERPEHARYSPAHCIGAEKKWIQGFPNSEKASTSHVERSNLTMRMQMRRFTRLTNGFSKKVENLGHAISLHFMHYNFCRVHQTLRITPAMAAGLSDHVWELEELVGLLDSN